RPPRAPSTTLLAASRASPRIPATRNFRPPSPEPVRPQLSATYRTRRTDALLSRGAAPCSRPCVQVPPFRVASITPCVPVSADQSVRRAVVTELGLRRALKFRDDALRQHLPKLHAPLVEGIDLPDD